MSSQVFALKYRPQKFSEMVGQETSVITLVNALKSKRLHHAYLMTGPRGIGKTSIARIFAKAVNCEKGPASEPCNECPVCKEITEGRSLDVLEIDGASNTSVDDIRELRERVKYLPSRGSYKIYIIDEVHMLSTSAFNALLKTLEEPPPHVIFIFATTEVHKVPQTIVSRVLKFDLHPLSIKKIVGHLKDVSKREGVDVADEGCFTIAREASGSLRDALSLLDQLVSFAGKKIKADDVQSLLGLFDRKLLMELADAIILQEPNKAVTCVAKIYESGIDLKRFSTDLLEYLRNLLIAKIGGKDSNALEGISEGELEVILKQADSVQLPALEQLFQIAYDSVQEIMRSQFSKILLEVLVLRLCTSQKMISIDDLITKVDEMEKISGNSFPVAAEKKTPSLFEARPPSSNPQTRFQPEAPRNVSPPDSKNWNGFVSFVKGKKPQLSSILDHGDLKGIDDSGVKIAFEEGSVYGDMLKDPERKDLLGMYAKEYFQRAMTFSIDFAKKVPGPRPPVGESDGNEDADAIVKDALSVFGPESTRVMRTQPKG